MRRRTGIGRVRHLVIGQLWFQERVRASDIEFLEWLGERGPADIPRNGVNQEHNRVPETYVGERPVQFGSGP
eukprot:11902758-Alexandrium_andersonii.AAC.1